MLRITPNWFSLLLALIVAILPFSQMMVNYLPSEEQHHTAMSPGSHMAKTGMDHSACDGCTIDHSCDSDSCACYQCGTCSATFLHEMMTVNFASLSALIPAATDGQLSHPPFMLFRPPRA